MSKLTVIPRNDLDSICEFLKKFKEWSLFLESDKIPTAWMVWPIYLQLNQHLVDLPDEPEIIKAMKEAGRTYVSKINDDIVPKMVHKVCTVLNPLLKNIAMASTVEKKDVYDSINVSILKNEPAVDNVEGDIAVRETSHIEILNQFMGEENLAMTRRQHEPNGYCSEFIDYLQANVSIEDPFKFDLIKWWFENRHVYPKLFRLFQSKCGIMASSAPSERSFSTIGIITCARRSSILPETVSDLMLARNKYLNFV